MIVTKTNSPLLDVVPDDSDDDVVVNLRIQGRICEISKAIISVRIRFILTGHIDGSY